MTSRVERVSVQPRRGISFEYHQTFRKVGYINVNDSLVYIIQFAEFFHTPLQADACILESGEESVFLLITESLF
jgi:hypothetical protein